MDFLASEPLLGATETTVPNAVSRLALNGSVGKHHGDPDAF
jgi:hypothetical protein